MSVTNAVTSRAMAGLELEPRLVGRSTETAIEDVLSLDSFWIGAEPAQSVTLTCAACNWLMAAGVGATLLLLTFYSLYDAAGMARCELVSSYEACFSALNR